MECVKECGEAKDCDVAFSLSSQCFNVHCYSRESCKTKPAFSNFYKPQLAYVKHRVLNTSLSKSKLCETFITSTVCASESQAKAPGLTMKELFDGIYFSIYTQGSLVLRHIPECAEQLVIYLPNRNMHCTH